MRDFFWFVAGVMVAVAGLFVALPLLRAQSDTANPSSRARLWIVAAAIVGISAAAVALYSLLGSPSAIGTASAPQPAAQAPASSGTAPSMEESTAKLAARLAADGGTSADWELLAQSYDFLGRPAEAAAAREHAGAPMAPPAAPATVAGIARITGTVELAAGLRERAPAGATLFIFARESGASGPPLAVLRVTADHWPVSFTLDDSNAMMPGRDLSHAGVVQVEARISRSGNAIAQSGDLVGTLDSVDPRSGKPVRIAIDRVF